VSTGCLRGLDGALCERRSLAVAQIAAAYNTCGSVARNSRL